MTKIIWKNDESAYQEKTCLFSRGNLENKKKYLRNEKKRKDKIYIYILSKMYRYNVMVGDEKKDEKKQQNIKVTNVEYYA